jgi:hypothetical protein
MSGWRQFAESIRQDDDAGTKGTKGTKHPVEAPFVPIVPIVPKAPPINPAPVLRDWHHHLVAIDDCRAPDGQSIMWWQQACDDARWIYENFASRAVREDWSAHDLFGVLPWHPGWGGLCDRLKGARNLKMAGPKAVWSNWGVPDWSCIGAGDQLITSGLMLIWEMGRGQAE